MGFPMLAEAIRAHGQPQWKVAASAGISEWRLSRILHRGTVRLDERARLSHVLGIPEDRLFYTGPVALQPVVTRIDEPTVSGTAAESR